jgi:small GTP-binding protein
MIKKKICMLGAFAVGKTSLVQQFVYSIFSSRYQTTVGVKIDKKTIALQENFIDLILWDLNGEDEFQEVRSSYLRGSSGCFYVIDGTRGDTFETAERLYQKALNTIGAVPTVFAVNKHDLSWQWEVNQDLMRPLKERGEHIIMTSAKTGQGVETAFQTLTKLMIANH